MSISSVGSTASQACRFVNNAPTAGRLMNMVSAIALPTIVLIGLAYLPGARAGGDTYWTCVENCVNSGGSPAWCAFLCSPSILI